MTTGVHARRPRVHPTGPRLTITVDCTAYWAETVPRVVLSWPRSTSAAYYDVLYAGVRVGTVPSYRTSPDTLTWDARANSAGFTAAGWDRLGRGTYRVRAGSSRGTSPPDPADTVTVVDPAPGVYPGGGTGAPGGTVPSCAKPSLPGAPVVTAVTDRFPDGDAGWSGASAASQTAGVQVDWTFEQGDPRLVRQATHFMVVGRDGAHDTSVWVLADQRSAVLPAVTTDGRPWTFTVHALVTWGPDTTWVDSAGSRAGPPGVEPSWFPVGSYLAFQDYWCPDGGVIQGDECILDAHREPIYTEDCGAGNLDPTTRVCRSESDATLNTNPTMTCVTGWSIYTLNGKDRCAQRVSPVAVSTPTDCKGSYPGQMDGGYDDGSNCWGAFPQCKPGWSEGPHGDSLTVARCYATSQSNMDWSGDFPTFVEIASLYTYVCRRECPYADWPTLIYSGSNKCVACPTNSTVISGTTTCRRGDDVFDASEAILRLSKTRPYDKVERPSIGPRLNVPVLTCTKDGSTSWPSLYGDGMCYHELKDPIPAIGCPSGSSQVGDQCTETKGREPYWLCLDGTHLFKMTKYGWPSRCAIADDPASFRLSGYVVQGTELYHTCPPGWSSSGAQCRRTFPAGTQWYTCGTGQLLEGTKCATYYQPALKETGSTYWCTPGVGWTLDGTRCREPKEPRYITRYTIRIGDVDAARQSSSGSRVFVWERGAGGTTLTTSTTELGSCPGEVWVRAVGLDGTARVSKGSYCG